MDRRKTDPAIEEGLVFGFTSRLVVTLDYYRGSDAIGAFISKYRTFLDRLYVAVGGG